MKLKLSIVLLVAAFAASAQVKLGVNAGGTLASIRGNEIAEQNDPGFNFMAGVTLEVPISERLSFYTAVNYEGKTVARDLPFDNLGQGNVPAPDDPAFMQGGIDAKYTLQYLTIPLNARYYFGTNKNFFVNGGPYVGIFLGESVKFNGDKIDTDESDIYKTFDFGFNLGLGVRVLQTGRHSLDIELRDNLGLTNISDVPIYGNGRLRTNSLNLIASWSFTL
ncbi:MAG: porin family protein [Flavobacterium sp.]